MDQKLISKRSSFSDQGPPLLRDGVRERRWSHVPDPACQKIWRIPSQILLGRSRAGSPVSSQTRCHLQVCQFVASPTAYSIKLDPVTPEQCDQKKLPNFYKSCLKMISLEKLKILTPLQKLPKNVGDLGQWIVAEGFKKVAQRPINRQIWSHCPEPLTKVLRLLVWVLIRKF